MGGLLKGAACLQQLLNKAMEMSFRTKRTVRRVQLHGGFGQALVRVVTTSATQSHKAHQGGSVRNVR